MVYMAKDSLLTLMAGSPMRIDKGVNACHVRLCQLTKLGFQMNEIDTLVPRPQVAREFGVASRTIIRWELQKLPGLHEPVVINKRIYHKRSNIELAKAGRAESAA
jgi:hypothetical protein